MCLLILACAILVVGADELLNETVFSKCCPAKESLMKKVDTDIGVQYSCVTSEYIETNYSVIVRPLVIGENVAVEYGMPQDCVDELQLTDVGDELSTENSHCYDRLSLELINDTLKQNIPQHILSLACPTQPKNNSRDYQIYNIRKCCPSGEVFDLEYHTCRNLGELYNKRWLNYIDPSGENIYDVDYGLHCKTTHSAVELMEEQYALVTEGNNLKASKLFGEEEHVFMRGDWCVDLTSTGRGLVARACTQDCSAFEAFCFKKCCPVGFHYEPRRCESFVSSCQPNKGDASLYNLSHYLDPLKSDPDYDYDVVGIQIGLPCPKGRFALNHSRPDDRHRLAADGRLRYNLGPPTAEFCLESFDYRQRCNGPIVTATLLCFPEHNDNKTKDFYWSFVAMSISCVCLALTLLVYCALPELHNLHGRTLICHVTMLLMAYCCLARVKYGYVADNTLCRLLGYAIYFGFVSAFSWLHVMCLDIWRTFGSVSVQPLHRPGAQCRRFLWYSLQAWGVSVVMTLTMFLLDTYPVASVLTAHIGRDFCWFGSLQNTDTDWAHYIFFVIPMGLSTCVNCVLWLLTSRHCHRVKSEVHRLQAGSVGDRAKKRFRVDRARYILTGKLWVVMGVGWIWELLTTVVSEPPWLWNSIDLFNELQGVWIFLILVMKPKIYYLVRKRLGLETPDGQRNGMSSGRTSSTFLSRTISSDERTHQRVSLTATKEKQ